MPLLDDWPLTASVVDAEQWTLVLDCGTRCEQQQDELWRLHRALGREAARLQRLRIGGSNAALPGETVVAWQHQPAWSHDHTVWLFDPMGRPALAFSPNVSTSDILDDIRHLFKVNPI
ncbi:hypothetical protein [Vreelandella lutescens]|uniref:hypothetical protein n=1 Tax=Vreelandella lutescens TaxID=1602943 RepID=UPI001E458928|nr:hypothetical protein [Halomonas lutescens]